MANLFSIPDKEKDYQSYMIYVLCNLWTVVTAAIVSVGFICFPHVWQRWLTFLGISLFIAILNLTLNRFGYTRLANWMLTIMLWLYITIPCYSAGGIMAPGILSQMSVILTAGFLLGWRGGLAIGLLTMGTDFGLAYMEVKGYLPNATVIHNPITRWIGAIIPFGTILALQYYATNHLHTGLIALQREIIKREEAEKIVHQTVCRLEERVKELNTLYAVSRILQDEDIPLQELLRKIAEIIPAGWQYPDITAACVCISGATYATSNYKPSAHYQRAEIITDRGSSLSIEIVYLQPAPESDEGPFLYEERRLINMLAEMIKMDIERRERSAERKEAVDKIKQSEQLIKKITSQIPGNTYLFEIEESGHTKILFISRGTNSLNHTYDFQELSEHPENLREILYDDDKVKFNDSMKEAYRTQSMISFQYRIVVDGNIRWRWMQAVPEKNENGKILWYGATSDITPLVDYVASIEQIIFDIGHVIRRPVCTMLSLSKLIIDGELSEKEIKEISQKLYLIAEEMDKFINELNHVYQQKRQNTKHNIDISLLIDKRSSLFN